MASPLLLPKSAAIPNQRLNVAFIVMYLAVLIFQICNFFATEPGTVKISNKSQLSLALSADSIANALNYHREADPLWALHTEDWQKHVMPGSRFPPFTKFHERFAARFLSRKDCDDAPHFEACLDLFETGNANSPFDIATALQNQFMTFGSNATLQDPSLPPLEPDELTVDTYLNVFTQAYSYNISYTYALDGAPSSFLGMNSNVQLYGSNRDTRTVLLGSDGLPKQTFEPGHAIIIRLPKLLELARGTVFPSEALIPRARSYGTFKGSAELFPSWVWENGCLLSMVVNCFSDDWDIRTKIGVRAVKGHDEDVWKFDASADEPVCLLDVRLADTKAFNWLVKKQQPGITVRENVVNLRVIGHVGHSFFRVMNANAVLLFITSSMVLLALPHKLISFIALNCLGRLSAVYRNILVQAVDIRQSCAKAVLQLVSQSVCFVELADRFGPGGQDYGGISRSRILERVRAVARHRSEDLDGDEVETLAGFTFSLLACHPPSEQPTESTLMSLKRALTARISVKSSEQDGTRSSEQDGTTVSHVSTEQDETKSSEPDDPTSIDIDSFCRATGGPGLSIDAIVKLFDRDKRLGIVERFFMPQDLKRTIHGARPRIPSGEEESGPDYLQERVPLEQKKSNVESLLIAQELAQAVENNQDVSAETPRLMGMIKDVSIMSEHVAFMRTSIEDLKLELQMEREIRSASESALRQEVSRALQANADEVDLKMVRVERADADNKDRLSQFRMGLTTATPDSSSKRDLVFLREDLDKLRRDLSVQVAQTKEQAVAEARMAVQELLKLHGQAQEAKLVMKPPESHQRRSTSASESTGEEWPAKLMAPEPIGKERFRSQDTGSVWDQRAVADVDTYGRRVRDAQADALPKVPVEARVKETERHQNLSAPWAPTELPRRRQSRDGNICTLNIAATECVDSWLTLPNVRRGAAV